MRERVALVLSLFALVATGCGGDDEEASQTVPPLPELTVPGENTPTLDDLPSTDTTETGTSTDGGAGGTVTPPADGGAEAPSGGGGAPSGGQAAPQDTPDNDTPPPAGSPAERFEEFCSENPGTC
ncbi:MAG TPA: hypothetical protein VNT32_08060 [Thermoleophilaceae bacterium]|nr:hypothetical protein [Thermoleophilaceae bacterium]